MDQNMKCDLLDIAILDSTRSELRPIERRDKGNPVQKRPLVLPVFSQTSLWDLSAPSSRPASTPALAFQVGWTLFGFIFPASSHVISCICCTGLWIFCCILCSTFDSTGIVLPSSFIYFFVWLLLIKRSSDELYNFLLLFIYYFIFSTNWTWANFLEFVISWEAKCNFYIFAWLLLIEVSSAKFSNCLLFYLIHFVFSTTLNWCRLPWIPDYKLEKQMYELLNLRVNTLCLFFHSLWVIIFMFISLCGYLHTSFPLLPFSGFTYFASIHLPSGTAL